MYTKFFRKFVERGDILRNFLVLILALSLLLLLFLVAGTSSVAMAYPVSEDDEIETPAPTFLSLARFLKDVRYARSDICDYHLADICRDVWFISGATNSSLSCLGLAVISVESDFDEDAFSSYGAEGLMQVVPKWHAARMERLGVDDLLDQHQNLVVGMDYLRELTDGYDDLTTALIHYTAGPSAVSSGNVSSVVRVYVEEVLRRFDIIQDFLETGHA